jgi:transposase InsO family protein
MRILQLRAARSWSAEQTARRFLVTEDTVASWIRRVDEEGESALVRAEEPVNKFPRFVAYLVRYLKRTCPTLGKVRIAQMLARAGLHLGASTVERMLKRDLSRDDAVAETVEASGKTIKARRPNDIWHVDLTVVPTSAGFWVPWLPFARVQRWPFCWWVAVAVDHTSRLVVGFAVFKRRPNSADVSAFLARAMKRRRVNPRCILSDKGKEFDCKRYRAWCKQHGIRPRYGAIGQHGSVAIIERFIRSMKSEAVRPILVPLRLDAMRHELRYYATWFNEHRPHTALGGRTPHEVYRGLRPRNERPRFEPRASWPRKARCTRPVTRVKGKCGVKLTLTLSRFENRAHLPVIELQRAA